jgi:type II secretory ATPase GspE/PulE/Tfp pilus assembly ATPase PilB-like protein
LFEVLHVTDAMRRVLHEGDAARQLPALAAADGLRPLVEQVRELERGGTIGAREAARLLS